MKNLKQQLIRDERYRLGIAQCLEKPQILIAPTNYCNLACDYCSTKYIRNSKVNMDLALLKSIVGQAVANGWHLSFGQTFEPFLHPEIVEIATYINDQGVRFSSATNGMAIRENAYGLPMNILLSFSATEADYGYRNSALPYEKYLKNQYAFLKYRIEHDVPGLISVQIADYTIFNGDITYDKNIVDISGIMQKAQRLGNTLDLDVDFDEEDWKRLVANRSPLSLYRKGDTVIQVQPIKILPNSYDAFVDLSEVREAKGYCDSCYTMMSIQADGKVAYCCCDQSANAISGVIDADTDLKDFWIGEKMDAIRRGFDAFAPINIFCTKCLHNVAEHIKPLLTSRNPKAVAEILHDFGVTEDQPWFKFPAS